MNKKIKLSVVFALSICFLIALSGCGEDNSNYVQTLPEDTMSSDAEQTTGSLLSAYDGWWHRPDDYIADGVSMVDIFKVDANSTTWTPYNEYGSAGDSFFCHADNNSLILDLAELGQVILFLDGENLLDENGKIHFVRGEEPQPEFSQATLTGTWYEKGMTKDYESLYIFSDTSYEHQFANGTVLSSGSFEMGNYSNSNLPYLALTDPNSIFSYAEYVLIDERLFYDTFEGKFFLHESVIGTPQEVKYTNIGNLLCGDWTEDKEDDGIPGIVIDFSGDGSFTDTTWVAKDGNYTGNQEEAGKWQVTEDGILLLTFLDGTAEQVDMSDDTFTVKYYGTIFKDDSIF